ncbi:MAG: hypothetical protein C4297_04440 [Gemmataceae bacterium]
MCLCVGNVVGSNIFNLTFILGLTALIRPPVIQGNTARLEYPVLTLATLMFLAVSQDLSVNWLDGPRFVTFFIGFMTYAVSLVRRQMGFEELAEFEAELEELGAGDGPGWLRITLCTVVGLLLLAGGANLTVQGATDLARVFGLSELIIGLTIVAGGTSLPEVAASLVAVLRGRDDVAVSNIVGSNLFNLLGILGLSSLLDALPIAESLFYSDSLWMMGVTVALLPVIFLQRRLYRWEGAALLAAYLAYIYFLVSQALR